MRFLATICLVLSPLVSSAGATGSPTCSVLGTYFSSPVVLYNCGSGAISVSVTEWIFQTGARGAISVSGVPAGPLPAMSGEVDCGDTTFTVTSTVPGLCIETHTLTGQFTSGTTWSGIYTVEFEGLNCYDCVDQQIAVSGSTVPTGIAPRWVRGGPTLDQNFPNPFGPSTAMRYSVATSGRATLRIYDVAGQLVRTLVEASPKPGTVYSVNWDGHNNDGQPVPTGIYFSALTTSSHRLVRKMILLR